MTAIAKQILTVIQQYGEMAELVDGRVRLRRAERLPEDVMARARMLKRDLARYHPHLHGLCEFRSSSK
jgi:hypothetical protein